ncbi:M16 family metallopeptidase [Paracoccus litorisediminis]|uniref:Insulinase family protein n=1 Tax=Paracoccus litorisediminis TaxID=2006130 RepID=A0A844HMX3_9RHOB|nr:pitrilysin family protein [Paracoccus litorisediminis]MTH59091.1 insulinase family protein [Paracoccus litorisediminis]
MTILKRLSPLALALLAATPALAEMPKGISHFKLDNGLEAVVIEDHRAPVVVQMLWYKIGSADEQPGKSGIAHYLEHLMFKGTDKLGPGELSKTVTANGGMDNAFTSYDYTAYFQRIAADRLPLVMEMESDRMANLKIGEDDWKAERQVVLEERSQRTDSDPGAQFGEERSAVQFYNHPYRRPVIGWRQEMEGLTRDDAVAWYDAHYAPNDAVLIIAGDVTAEKAKELAEKYYGPIAPKADSTRKPRPQEPEQRADRRMERSDPRVPQPVLIRTVLAPERNASDQKQAAALSVLAELLAGSAQTSVLARDLVLTGKALYVDASYDGLTVDPTTFGISLVPAPGTSNADAEAALDAALAKFLQDGPDAAQLERVKTQIRASRIYAQDSAHGRAYDYGQGLSVGLTVEDVNDWPDVLGAVTAEDIREAAKLVLESRGSVTAWLLPEAAPANAAPGPAAEAAAQPVPTDAANTEVVQ